MNESIPKCSICANPLEAEQQEPDIITEDGRGLFVCGDCLFNGMLLKMAPDIFDEHSIAVGKPQDKANG